MTRFERLCGFTRVHLDVIRRLRIGSYLAVGLVGKFELYMPLAKFVLIYLRSFIKAFVYVGGNLYFILGENLLEDFLLMSDNRPVVLTLVFMGN